MVKNNMNYTFSPEQLECMKGIKRTYKENSQYMSDKYPNVVSIPGAKNQERILENPDASMVELTQDEFSSLEASLNQRAVQGHRGFTR